MEKWHHYLYGKQDITVHSDHQPWRPFSRNLWAELHTGFREWCWELSLYCSVQERERALRGRHSVSRGSQWWTRKDARVRCISCESHTDGPVTKPCQTRYNESDRRGHCERPILNDTVESGAWWLALPKAWSTKWTQSLLGLQRWDFRIRWSPGGGTLGISGWECAAGTLEPLAYTTTS